MTLDDVIEQLRENNELSMETNARLDRLSSTMRSLNNNITKMVAINAKSLSLKEKENIDEKIKSTQKADEPDPQTDRGKKAKGLSDLSLLGQSTLLAAGVPAFFAAATALFTTFVSSMDDAKDSIMDKLDQFFQGVAYFPQIIIKFVDSIQWGLLKLYNKIKSLTLFIAKTPVIFIRGVMGAVEGIASVYDDFGKAVNKTFGKATGLLYSFVKMINNIIRPVTHFIETLLKLPFHALFAAFEKVTKFVAGLFAPLFNLVRVFGRWSGFVGLMMITFDGLIAGFKELTREGSNIGTILVETLRGVVNSIKTTIDGVIDIASWVTTQIAKFFGLEDQIRAFWNAIQGVVDWVFKGFNIIIDVVKGLFDGEEGSALAAFNKIGYWLQDGWKVVEDGAVAFGNSIIYLFDNAAEIFTKLKTMFDDVVGMLARKVNWLAEQANKIPGVKIGIPFPQYSEEAIRKERLKNFVYDPSVFENTKLPAFFDNIRTDIESGMRRDMSAMVEKVADTARSGSQIIMQAAPSVYQDNSVKASSQTNQSFMAPLKPYNPGDPAFD